MREEARATAYGAAMKAPLPEAVQEELLRRLRDGTIPRRRITPSETRTHTMTGESFGDRMKAYELPTRILLPRRSYTVLRVDGRAFHTYLKNARKPFDGAFIHAMGKVAEALCAEITGAVLAYAQSDEVSVLYTDFRNPAAEPWFGGVAAKQVSIAASLATYVLGNSYSPPGGGRPLFDARVFTLPTRRDVADYFVWRQADALRNSVSMAAQAYFTPEQLHGMKASEVKELLRTTAAADWDGYRPECRLGQVTTRTSTEKTTVWTDPHSGAEQTTTTTRSVWTTRAAPRFTTDPGGWLDEVIPDYTDIGTTQES